MTQTNESVRAILIDDPEFIFPLSLQQVTLYRSMDAQNTSAKTRARQQMKVVLTPPPTPRRPDRRLTLLVRASGSYLERLLSGSFSQSTCFRLLHPLLHSAGSPVAAILSISLALVAVGWACSTSPSTGPTLHRPSSRTLTTCRSLFL
jgi:hypothetical protein